MALPACTTLNTLYSSMNPTLRIFALPGNGKLAPASVPSSIKFRIENLDSREYWIPLQDSFVFDWHVATAESLEHLYIEKGPTLLPALALIKFASRRITDGQELPVRMGAPVKRRRAKSFRGFWSSEPARPKVVGTPALNSAEELI